MEDYLTVTLFNQSYKFRFDADRVNGKEAADVLLCEVGRVSEQLREPVYANKFVVLVMAAMNIAVNNIAQKRNCQTQMSAISGRSLRLIKRLDNYIALHIDLVNG